jgi:hypothetical protein
MVDAAPKLGDPEQLLAELLRLGGPAVADESPYRSRIEKRRERRRRRFMRNVEYMRTSREAWEWSSSWLGPRLTEVEAMLEVGTVCPEHHRRWAIRYVERDAISVACPTCWLRPSDFLERGG